MKESFFEQPLFPQPGKTPREDTAAVMKFYKLPKSFPPEVLREARRISAPSIEQSNNRPIEQSLEGRLDLR